jgi:hypothetical protein
MKIRRKTGPSQLSRQARAILSRTAIAQGAIDAAVTDVVVEGGPPELGPKRKTAQRAWLDRDITKRVRNGGVSAPNPKGPMKGLVPAPRLPT